MKRFGFCLAIALGAAAIVPAAEPVVRARILYTLAEVPMTSESSWKVEVLDPASKDHRTAVAVGSWKIAADGREVKLTAADGSELLRGPMLALQAQETSATLGIAKVPFGIGWWWEATEDRRYTGRLEARVNEAGKLDVVNVLPMEEYLCGVVPSEIGANSPAEALKAQAVAARSETVVALREQKYAGPGYDICADVECQAFSGATKRSAASDRAVYETRSLALFHHGEPFGAYYASNCGGYSENVENVWADRSGPKPYWSAHCDSDTTTSCPVDLTDEAALAKYILEPPADVWCNPQVRHGLPSWSQKNFRWRVEKTADELTALVAKKKDIGRVLAVKPLGRGPSGRLLKAAFVGEKGTFEIGPELAIRQVIDPPLRSACFFVETEGDPQRPDKFVFVGAGWGHGVGMCQTGAVSRAMAGQDFRRILAHYYRESEVLPAYSAN